MPTSTPAPLFERELSNAVAIANVLSATTGDRKGPGLWFALPRAEEINAWFTWNDRAFVAPEWDSDADARAFLISELVGE